MSEKLPPINEKRRDKDETDGKWLPRNWKKRNDNDLRKMAPQLRSKYLAYEEPPKDVAHVQEEARKRLRERKKEKEREEHFYDHAEEMTEREKHEKLIGQLKAAEARNRIRIMRLRYEANRSEEVNHLISCQPNARNAVRLQALLPIRNQDKLGQDALDKISNIPELMIDLICSYPLPDKKDNHWATRGRVEALLEDSQGLITGRT